MKTTRRDFAFMVSAAIAAAKAQLPATKDNHRDEAQQKLRAVKLANGDEPDFTFSALAKR